MGPWWKQHRISEGEGGLQGAFCILGLIASAALRDQSVVNKIECIDSQSHYYVSDADDRTAAFRTR